MERDPLISIVETVAALPQAQKAALHDSLYLLLNRLYKENQDD